MNKLFIIGFVCCLVAFNVVAAKNNDDEELTSDLAEDFDSGDGGEPRANFGNMHKDFGFHDSLYKGVKPVYVHEKNPCEDSANQKACADCCNTQNKASKYHKKLAGVLSSKFNKCECLSRAPGKLF